MNELLATYTSLPNLHPAVVHFPIALLPLAVLFDLVALLRRRRPFWDRLAAVFYALGAAGALAAVRAGEQAADVLTDVPPAVQPRIAEHSDTAHLVLYLFGALAVARLVLWWRDRASERLGWLPVRWVALLVGLYGLVPLASTADQGGGLVYRFRLGVVPLSAPPPTHMLDHSPEIGPPAARLVDDGSGVRRWTPLAGDVTALGSLLEPAAGFSREAVKVIPPAAGDVGLGLAVDGRTLLVFTPLYGDVQVDAELDLSEFEGRAGVAHHVHDEATRAHFAIATGGTAELVDVRGGDRKLLGDGELEAMSRAPTLSVSSTGRHLKGMVDGATLAHGHIAPGEPGRVGLLLDGRGKVRVLSMTVTPLSGG